MDLTQQPELRHKVTLSPQVYQGLSILAMPVVELQTLIENEVLENPVLEVEEDDYEPAASEERLEASEEERAWDEWLDQYEELERMDGSSTREPMGDDVNTEEFVGGVVSFTEHLLEQLAMMDVDDGLEVAAKAVIGSLDDDGFFVGTVEEIAAIAGVPLEVAVQALGVVQQLDPPGVGARSVQEALRIQAETVGLDTPLLLAMIDGYLDDVAASRYKKIARALGSDEASVRETVEMLRTLNPRPAGAFSSGSAPAYVVPDVTIRRFGDEWLVLPNTEAVPGLRVNSRYRSMLRSDSSATMRPVAT